MRAVQRGEGEGMRFASRLEQEIGDAVHCPRCNADAGRVCVTSGGRVSRMIHLVRVDLFRECMRDKRTAVTA